ncbi:MAG: transporter [Firmicutes bacterium]|nr:transporter [Bacillota bacterium]
MKFLNSYKGLPKSVYIIFIVQIINRLGDFVLPFLALLLTQKLGISFGATGFIVMTASLSMLVASFIGGKFADTVGRRITYLGGQSMAGVLIFFCGFIHTPAVIILLLIAANFFNGFVRPSLGAILSDVLPPDKRQAGIALNHLGVNIGVAVGPMMAGFLFNHFLPLLYIGDALSSFVAVMIFYKYIQETKPTADKLVVATHEERIEKGNLWQALCNKPQIMVFLTISVLYSFVYRQGSFSLPFMLNEVYPLAGAEKFGLLMSTNAITVVCLSLVTVALTQRYHPLTNVILAGIFYGIGYGMIGLISTFPLFMVSTVVWTMGEILAVANMGVYVANNSPANFRARFNALSNLTSALGGALGTSLMGMYITVEGVKAVWPLTAFVAILGAGLLFGLKVFTKDRKVYQPCMQKKITP